MKSHSYPSFHLVWRGIAIPVAMLLLFAAVMHGVERAGWPSLRPLLDLDRTILTHQVSLATRAPPAQIVWLGDSSCLMDIDPTHRPGLINLGTISHLGLNHHARLLERYLQHAAKPPDLVVVLLHPDALRRERDDISAGLLFESLMSAKGSHQHQTISARFGFDIFRDRILARMIPIPLNGAYGRTYGYTCVAYATMEKHLGGLIAAGMYDPATDLGNNEVRLGEKTANEAIALRANWPSGIRLAIGLAPVPASCAARDHAAQAVEILRAWNQHMKADIVLEQLPLVLPDVLFADRRHLNQTGRTEYTASALRLLPD